MRPPESPGPDPAGLSWTAQPFRRRKRSALLVVGLLVVTAVGLGALTRSVFWGLFSVAALFLSLEAFFLPSHYQLGPEGVTLRKPFSRVQVTWDRFRRVHEDRHGLTLSPYTHRTFMEPYRSTRLLYDGGDPEAIRRAVRFLMRPGAEWRDPAGKVAVLASTKPVEEADGVGRSGQSPSREDS
jgi:hypothetical protein